MHNIGVLFSATRQVSMDLESDPNLSFTARLLFDTLDTVSHPVHEQLQDFRDDRSGKSFPSSIDFVLVFNFLLTFLLPSQVVAGVRNLMRQNAQLFKLLEAAKTMRAYIAHNMDGNEELRVGLEAADGELAVAQKVIDEGVKLLKKTENVKETVKAEARRLVKERDGMETDKKKVEKEVEWLRQEL